MSEPFSILDLDSDESSKLESIFEGHFIEMKSIDVAPAKLTSVRPQTITY